MPHLLIKSFIILIGDRSSGLGSEIEEVEDENRSDLCNSDNEDNNSIISQTMTSTSTLKENASVPIGIFSLCNSSADDVDIVDNRAEGVLKNNNDISNRNLESMKNSLIDVEQRLRAQRY